MRDKPKNNQSEKNGKRIVHDRQGTGYELVSKLSEGGQGIVCRTQFPNVLVKVTRFPPGDQRADAWYKHLQWVSRLPLDELKIARPLTLIVKPRPGYVMELMDGLVPLQMLLGESIKSVDEGKGLVGFIESGGLSRRLRLLAGLARTLAELHGRGLAYGDLAPGNVFVSHSNEHSEVWLIDCDNISQLSRAGGQKIYTPDYGAPEIVRGESGIDSLTDSWSFAVIAFQLLTLQHPLKGDLVNDGEPEEEERALRGELPWIDDPEDEVNRTTRGLPRDLVLTKPLRSLFQQCFGPGLNEPEMRPSLMEWRSALEAAAALLLQCTEGDGCGSSFYINTARQCPFCDRIQSDTESLFMQHYLYAPPTEEDNAESVLVNPWIKTGYGLVLSREPIELRASPVGTITYPDSDPVCSLEIKDDGLWIEPMGGNAVALQSQSRNKTEILKKRMRLNDTSRRGDSYMLHLADSADTHYAWHFKW